MASGDRGAWRLRLPVVQNDAPVAPWGLDYVVDALTQRGDYNVRRQNVKYLSFMAHYSFLLLFLLVIFSAACAANAQTPSAQATTSSFPESSHAKQGLDFSVGPRGLDSLWYNGQPFLLSPESGELQPWKSAFRAGLDLLFPLTSSSIPAPAKRPDTVDLIYPWGRVSYIYIRQGDKIRRLLPPRSWSPTGCRFLYWMNGPSPGKRLLAGV